jgi:hypothetical protein
VVSFPIAANYRNLQSALSSGNSECAQETNLLAKELMQNLRSPELLRWGEAASAAVRQIDTRTAFGRNLESEPYPFNNLHISLGPKAVSRR